VVFFRINFRANSILTLPLSKVQQLKTALIFITKL